MLLSHLLFFGTAYCKAGRLFLVAWMNCNWEILSAACSGFVCWPTSLVPASSTFPGISDTCPCGCRKHQLGSMLSALGRRGWPIRGLAQACLSILLEEPGDQIAFICSTSIYLGIYSVPEALSWTLGRQKWKPICSCPASGALCDIESFLGLFRLPI